MIKLRNLDHVVVALSVPGTLTSGASKACAVVPFNGFVANIVGVIGTPGSGATNTVADVNYLGTTIFGAATKLTLAATTGVASYSALTDTVLQVTAGSQFTLDLDSVPTSGANLEVLVTISKTPVAAPANLVDHSAIM